MNREIKSEYADVVIIGTGVAGLYSALNLPRDKRIIMITKSDAESSDSFLAQGGICVLRNDADYESYFEDTMRAGHYENRRESVDIMIRSSQEVIRSLIGYGVRFQKLSGEQEEQDTERIRIYQRRGSFTAEDSVPRGCYREGDHECAP